MTTARAIDALTDVSEEPQTEALKELVSDCTCPICQAVYTNPHKLSCGHTFCLRCFDKLSHKWRKSNNSSGGGSSSSMLLRQMLPMPLREMIRSGSGDNDPLLCPVCRSSIDPHQPTRPDPTAGTLLQALKAVKASRCKQPDCWREPSVCCVDCACGLCGEHHRAKLAALKTSCAGVADDAERFLQAKQDEAGRLDGELADARGQLDELHQALARGLQDRMDQCSEQLAQARQQIQAERGELADASAGLGADAAQLRQLLSAETPPSRDMLAQRSQLEVKLRATRSRYPPSKMQLGFESAAKVTSDHEALLGSVSVRVLKRPYVERGEDEKLRPSLLRRTKSGEPWEVRLMDEGKLLVNFKGFPTRRLHVFSASSLAETDTVELQMTKSQFPGQMCVCPKRQRILTSDPKNHCVYEFDFRGRLTGQFGSKGAEQDQLHTPKGLYVYDNTLYVADSKNKRVQLFDMDQSYQCIGSIKHEAISTNIQAVFAGPACVVVCDRGTDALLVFDRATCRYTKKVPAGGEPFDVCTDQFDNIIVSLTQQRKVKVFDSSVTQCINTFTVHGGSGVGAEADEGSLDIDKLHNYLHGLAFDCQSGRLFVAEAFAKRILGFEI